MGGFVINARTNLTTVQRLAGLFLKAIPLKVANPVQEWQKTIWLKPVPSITIDVTVKYNDLGGHCDYNAYYNAIF